MFIFMLGFHQLIAEPTYLFGDSNSCIDLINSTSLLSLLFIRQYMSKATIKLFTINYVSNIALLPYTRKIWYHNKADFVTIRKCIEMFVWKKHLDNMTCLMNRLNHSKKSLLIILIVTHYFHSFLANLLV